MTTPIIIFIDKVNLLSNCITASRLYNISIFIHKRQIHEDLIIRKIA